ncbi:hypothetical protein H0H92_002520 [Tricholoma furcatifolium]|nr:hypothetical protein H0H92_002520 [Tricholoma furcatifolium]
MLRSFLAALAVLTVVSGQTVTVQLNSASVVGNYNATTGVDEFLGISYGSAPRFSQATMMTYSSSQTINATANAPACPQIAGTNSLAVNYGIYGTSENCTTLDIQRPHGIQSGTLLPVMVWIHGGALTQGASWYYPGNGIVQQSVSNDMPVITVIMQYRLAAWGFLGGNEASANGAQNLGLYDQKLALEWVQNNIKSFGGDPTRVTVFGQSSGSMSIAYHMLNTSQALFSGAIMESGTSTSVPVLAPSYYEYNYNALVDAVNCNGASNTFDCLLAVDMETMINATNLIYSQPTVYGSRPWGVTLDYNIIPGPPALLTAEGQIANIPFIVGDVMDEGTIFVKPNTIATDADLWSFLENDYINHNASFFTNVNSQAILGLLYPNDPSLGSPYYTGDTTFFGAEFKRAAAIYGDLHFQWPRRNWLAVAAAKGINSWSYLFNQTTPGNAAWEGVLHTGEIPYVFMNLSPSEGNLYTLAQQVSSYWINFAYNQNPNEGVSAPTWSQYDQSWSNNVFTAALTNMQPDTYRILGTNFIGLIAEQFLEAA